MLVKKQVENNKIRTIYSSSNICAAIYDKNSKDLTIFFNNGGQYKYADVSETVYMRFEIADSQGQVFNSHIKQHLFEKLDKIDVKEILNEVAEIKNADDALVKKFHEDNLFTSIRTFMAIYDTTNNLKLDDLKSAIATYETSLKKD